MTSQSLYHRKLIINIIIILIFSFFLSKNLMYSKPIDKKKSEQIKDNNSIVSYPDSCKMLKNDSLNCGYSKGKCRMRDDFIDNDNDGINDNRCKGIGFGKQLRKGKGLWKKK